MRKLLSPLFILLRRCIYLTLGTIDALLLRKSLLVVLSYHSVCDDSWLFSIDKKVIERQLSYLRKHYELLTLDDVAAVVAGKKNITKPSVVITFDDGYKDILTMKPFFEKEKIIPTLFVLSNRDNANWKELDTTRTLLTDEEIRSLSQKGWFIESHSMTHANLPRLSGKRLTEEIETSKQQLEKLLKKPVKYFAYPRGKYSEQVVKSVRNAGYTLAFSMDDGIINEKTNPFIVPRVGVDRSHSFSEFRVLFSPLVIRFRQLIKTSPFGKYL